MVRCRRRFLPLGSAALALALLAFTALAQVSPDLYAGLRWRNIGPFRGGRVASVSGVIGQPGTFYIGLPLGGVWKTTSAGEVWYPIFDSVPGADCIGAIEVAPSDPNIIYAGTGDLVTGGGINVGDGMYKSTDAGATWSHIGLEGTQHINSILVDPKNPNLVLASTQGDLRKAGPDRGIYRSTDGGAHWQQVLHPDDSTGARDMHWAFDRPNVVFATTIADIGGGGFGGGGFGGGAAGGAPPVNRTKLYKSTDEGLTWSEVTGPTVPTMTGRTAVAVAMNTDAQRIYYIGPAPQGAAASGLYRSDDQGATWKHIADGDIRITNGQGAYSCGVWVDSQNPDIVYTASTSTYRSTDGGKTFASFKGAPGGDDYHAVWIDPSNGKRLIFGTDQGATISLDAGTTWSSWYNQPTDQVYHISTDNRYPYWVYAAQQDSGSTAIRNRGDLGEITALDWWPVPGYEFGSLAPDPLHPGVVYAQGPGSGSVIRIVQATGQWENVGPNFGADNHYRQSGNAMRLFDPLKPTTLYMAYQCLVATSDGGTSWKDMSPDLTTAKGQPTIACDTPAPAPAGRGRGGRGTAGAAGAPTTPALPATPPAPVAGAGRGAAGSISNFSISSLREGVIWTGSTNSQVYNTMDGGLHWNNVSNFTGLPTGNNDFASIEAGHFDVNTAYVAEDHHGAGDYAPYIWRTHDGGKTWTKIVNGLPDNDRTGDFVRVVREDPKQKGLLFCGTETSVYVSFDDGDHWQSLRLNLPTTSFRDMVFHYDDHMNDLVVGTYGRSLYILDDITPLRQLAVKAQAIAAAPAYLFQPGDAIRVRRDTNGDTPFPPEVPHAENPPVGAILYYHLSATPASPITLQIYDAAGKLVRTMSSVPPPPDDLPPAPVPSFWIRKPQVLPTAVGTNRVNWDLLYDRPPALIHDIESMMGAVPFDSPYTPEGPLALPGAYTVKLSVDGKVYSQPLVVHNDPRVGEGPAMMAALRAQTNLILAAYHGMFASYNGNNEVAAVRAQVKTLTASQLPTEVASAATALDTKLATFGGAVARGGRGGGRGGRGGAVPPGTVIPFSTLNASFGQLVDDNNVGGIDMAPNQPQLKTWSQDCKEFNTSIAAWKTMQTQDLVAFNALLSKNNLKPLALVPTTLVGPACGLGAAPGAGAAAAAQ